MKIGLPVELLVQLFLVFEGYSLWKLMKLPETTQITITDYNEACQAIFKDARLSAAEQADWAARYKKALSWLKHAQRILGWFEKPYLVFIFLSVFLVVSSWINIHDEPGRLILAFLIAFYFSLKLIVYWGGKKIFMNYKAEQDKLSSVPVPNAPAGDFSSK